MEKLSGNPDMKYYSNTLKSYLDLVVGGNGKGYTFVYGNMCLISLYHKRRIFADKRITPFINITIYKKP